LLEAYSRIDEYPDLLKALKDGRKLIRSALNSGYLRNPHIFDANHFIDKFYIGVKQ
jgi:hypothetical protein